MERSKSIGFQIRTLANQIRRTLDEEKTCEEKKELTGMQGWIIGYIYDHAMTQDVFQRDIEKEFDIRRSTATAILQLLEKNGYILREPVAYDARLKKLILTPKAIDHHVTIMSRVRKIETKLSAGLSEGEKQLFLEIVEKIKANLGP